MFKPHTLDTQTLNVQTLQHLTFKLHSLNIQTFKCWSIWHLYLKPQTFRFKAHIPNLKCSNLRHSDLKLQTLKLKTHTSNVKCSNLKHSKVKVQSWNLKRLNTQRKFVLKALELLAPLPQNFNVTKKKPWDKEWSDKGSLETLNAERWPINLKTINVLKICIMGYWSDAQYKSNFI